MRLFVYTCECGQEVHKSRRCPYKVLCAGCKKVRDKARKSNAAKKFNWARVGGPPTQEKE